MRAGSNMNLVCFVDDMFLHPYTPSMVFTAVCACVQQSMTRNDRRNSKKANGELHFVMHISMCICSQAALSMSLKNYQVPVRQKVMLNLKVLQDCIKPRILELCIRNYSCVTLTPFRCSLLMFSQCRKAHPNALLCLKSLLCELTSYMCSQTKPLHR